MFFVMQSVNLVWLSILVKTHLHGSACQQGDFLKKVLMRMLHETHY